jgi:hypothetical protein
MAKRSIVLQKKNALAYRMVARAWSVIDAPRLGYPLSGCVPAIRLCFTERE